MASASKAARRAESGAAAWGPRVESAAEGAVRVGEELKRVKEQVLKFEASP